MAGDRPLALQDRDPAAGMPARELSGDGEADDPGSDDEDVTVVRLGAWEASCQPSLGVRVGTIAAWPCR